MKRYHVALEGFEANQVEQATARLNGKRFIYSSHFFHQVMARFNDKEQRILGDYLRAYELKKGECFEYYEDNRGIIKICYRLPFTQECDIVLVLAMNKSVITIYRNNVNDHHQTLNKNQYQGV